MVNNTQLKRDPQDSFIHFVFRKKSRIKREIEVYTSQNNTFEDQVAIMRSHVSETWLEVSYMGTFPCIAHSRLLKLYMLLIWEVQCHPSLSVEYTTLSNRDEMQIWGNIDDNWQEEYTHYFSTYRLKWENHTSSTTFPFSMFYSQPLK